MVAGHPEGEAGRAEEDHLDSGAAEGEDEAEFIEEKESEETSGELTGPGERWLVIEEADVGEAPEVVEDEQN